MRARIAAALVATMLWIPLATAQSSATVTVTAAGHPSIALTAADLASMPHVKVTATSHGKTAVYEGVPMRELLTRAGVPSGEALRGADLARSVVVAGADGYKAAFGLAEFDPGFTDRLSILADRSDGAPLAGTAGPFQLILEGEKKAGRWVRQVTSIEVR